MGFKKGIIFSGIDDNLEKTLLIFGKEKSIIRILR